MKVKKKKEEKKPDKLKFKPAWGAKKESFSFDKPLKFKM